MPVSTGCLFCKNHPTAIFYHLAVFDEALCGNLIVRDNHAEHKSEARGKEARKDREDVTLWKIIKSGPFLSFILSFLQPVTK